MIIGVELRHIVLAQTGGVTQLLKGVVDAATALAPQHTFHVFCTAFNRALLNADRTNVCFHTLPLTSFYADVDKICAEQGVDVLFRGYPAESTLTFPLSRTVFQIPDIQHEEFPEFFEPEVLRSRKAAFDVALSQAGAVGTISEFARDALRAYAKTEVDDIFLMPPALQDEHADAKECTPAELKQIPNTPYFIFPANLWAHKNHERLLEAFEQFRRGYGHPFELVLTGHPSGWDALATRFPHTPVRHLGFVRPQLLRALLERSVAMVFFSLHEGFGMPLLEAFNARTAVMCSNTSSLPEVGGDAVLSCDPLDVGAMAETMSRLVRSPELRAQLIEKGASRISAYSWDASARALLDAFDRVASQQQQKKKAAAPVQVPVDGPLVTVVTPSYNQGRFLRRTIESVLTQSYKNIELFVMDGGSTDESVEILKSYGNRIKWVSEKDRGQTHAINKGLTQARGSILAYLNSDDVFLPDAIAKVVNYFNAHPDVSMLYGKAHYIDVDDNVTGDYRTAEYSPEALAEECIICQPATFWRRELQTSIGEFDERLHFVMDYDFWLRAARSGAGIAHLPEYLASSRLYPDTKTLSARGKIYSELFDVCWKHNQYIGRDYFIGYWHHKIYERDNLFAKMLRKRPFAHVVLGRLSYVYTSRCKRSPKAFAYVILNKLKARREKWGTAKGAGNMAMPVHAKVKGFYPDNWLMPELRIRNPRTAVGGLAFLQGRSPVVQTVEILADGRKLLTQQLRENVESRIELHFPDEPISELSVCFSRHQNDPANRPLSFALEATNMFGEHDLTF